MTALWIISIFVLALTILALSYWLVVLLRVRQGLRRRPTVREGVARPAPEAGWPKLSIIVPAHNEERVIEDCARSLRGQDYPNLEIIFVLDRCTDRTAALLRAQAEQDPRLIVIENEACPDDWAGKCNAAWLGAARARGDFLLFTDADTQFDEALARAATALALDRGADLLTLLTTLSSDRYHERVAQPVATICLLHMYPMNRVRSDRKPRAFANGQFMLFRREWYERIGGHATVKDALLEDLAFARQAGRTGGRVVVLLADGMLRCSMYDTMGAFVRGWKRIFIDACRRKPQRLRKHGRRVLFAGLVLPAAQVAMLALAGWWLGHGLVLVAGALTAIVVAGLVAQVIALATIYALAGAPRWTIAMFPLGCWIVGTTLVRAARDLEHRRPIVWGGRAYVPEPE